LNHIFENPFGSVIDECRACTNRRLIEVFSLGEIHLSGHFPEKSHSVPQGELTLLSCEGDSGCGLVQLSRNFPQNLLYGEQYGYRSGLNKSMVDHLEEKIESIMKTWSPKATDVVIDIGANDGTSLSAYPADFLRLIAVDPLVTKFNEFYPKHIYRAPSFFSRDVIESFFPGEKAKIITSFSMLYDLPKPLEFIFAIRDSLRDDGVWVSEQSYLPTMLAKNSFDTICHEHLEYYSLSSLNWMMNKAGLKIIDCETNETNGGSISFTATHQSSPIKVSNRVSSLLKLETEIQKNTSEVFADFAVRAEKTKQDLRELLLKIKSSGSNIAGIGASTKGNVLLEWMGIDTHLLPFIGDVNPDKWGKTTPGTRIPITREEEALEMKNAYLLVLPWHFKSFFLQKFKGSGLNLIFPLPDLEIIKV
jgi:NDP-4-keto-2,6-dideoxyhexose 3-C-methyltransferase